VGVRAASPKYPPIASARPRTLRLAEPAPLCGVAPAQGGEARRGVFAVIGLHAPERIEAAALTRLAWIDAVDRRRVEAENIGLNLGRQRRIAEAVLEFLADL
jgi:hypothetical protein